MKRPLQCAHTSVLPSLIDPMLGQHRFIDPIFVLANPKAPNKLLAPTREEDMPINNTNAFYEVHKGLNLDRSHWYTLIEGQNGRFVIYEYDDYKVAANEPEGCEMIPLETFLMDGKFDTTAQLKLRRLLEDEVIQEETA